MQLQRQFQDEVAAEVARNPPAACGLITEAALQGLPAPVQRFFRSSGFVGRPCTMNARIVWKTMLLKRSRRAGWMKLRAEQFMSVPEPVRIALMSTRIAGMFPFAGRDIYRDGHGQMLIQLLKCFTVADSHGSAMDESALVTFLSEALFAPSAALQDYIEWSARDARSAFARLRHRGLCVSGTFHFNEADELVRFDTGDRWRDGSPPVRMPWSANVASYQWVDGVRTPRALSATWHEPGGDFTYVQGVVDAIVFNVAR